MTERVNGILDKFKNPAIWIALIGSIFWISIRLNNVDIIESRLNKKIQLQNEMHDDQDDMKSEFKDEIHRLEIQIKDLEAEIKILQTK